MAKGDQRAGPIMFHRTCTFLVAVALVGFLLLLIGLVWIKRQVLARSHVKLSAQQHRPLWPAVCPQPAELCS